MRNKFGRKQNEQKDRQENTHTFGIGKQVIGVGEGRGEDSARIRAGNSENVKSLGSQCDVRRRRKSILATSFQ